MEKTAFKVGDQIRVIFKAASDGKSKSTPFEGVLIASRGSGSNKTFTVRKVTPSRVAVERIFPLSSPNIDQIKVVKPNKVRRAKLYYLRKK